jgi:ABC-type multidrug transport system fused ATPase/permease subunit
LTTIIASFIISFIAGWQMTLVMLIIFPILTICGVVQFKILSGFGSKSKKFIERSSLIAVEGLRAIRVVASFNAEESLYRRFAEKQARIVRIGSRSAFLAGLGFGGTQFFLFASYALSFYVGALFVEKNYMTFEDMMKVFLSLEMASMMAGQVIAQAAMVDKARAALIDLYSLVDRKSLYDCRSESGQKHPITHGKIEFKDVKFHYPTAPLLPVLKGVSFVIDPETLPLITNSYQSNELTKDSDQTLKKSTGTRECYFVGVIGSSGGGKSTMFSQLLPHFYRTVQPGGDENFVPAPEGATLEEIAAKEKAYAAEKEILEKKLKKRLNLQQRNGAKAGQIFLDGHNIDTFNLHHLRQHMALVQQEPVLFHGTIRENIIAGDESISEEEMIEAAKIAYIHHIIIQLPKGYNTMLTSNNSLSGGQKARVAIARALARKNLKLIAFDESTSALDVKASRIILHNLRHSMKDKILVFIAHRLETVVNAQKILVLDNGVIAENGTHKELYALNGIMQIWYVYNNNLITTKKNLFL